MSCPQPDLSRPNTSQRILIAEDDAGTRAVVALQMQLAGLDADFAADGAAALALYEAAAERGRPYALLVLDGAMPAESGFSVAEAVRARGDNATPIAFLTADDTTFSHARGQLTNPVGYWVKPLAVVDLPARIMQVLVSTR